MDAVSVTAPRGFRAQGVASGIKPAGQFDLAVLAAARPGPAAAVFTTNRAVAAPVTVSKRHLATGAGIIAVVANAGCANAATGAVGAAAAQAMAEATAAELGCAASEVLVASTGPIGPQLPMGRVEDGISRAVAGLDESPEAANRAAAAILTTDSITKEVVVPSDGFTVGAMVKGSGMIRPDMATMLAFLTTDAIVGPERLDEALRPAVDVSFNSLNIDGCESTNDTTVVLASGESGVRPGPGSLREALTRACLELAEMMARDAEGAARVVSIDVTGASSDEIARAAGRAMADSALVRASFYGGDPNWGRLIGALGASDVEFDPARFGISYEGVTVAEDGMVITYDAPELLERMASGDLEVEVTLGAGPGRARILTTDLTPDYVRFNLERS